MMNSVALFSAMTFSLSQSADCNNKIKTPALKIVLNKCNKAFVLNMPPKISPEAKGKNPIMVFIPRRISAAGIIAAFCFLFENTSKTTNKTIIANKPISERINRKLSKFMLFNF